MKNLTKLWGTLVTLLIVGAASWYGLDPSAHDTSQNQVSENTKITDSSIAHRSSVLPTKADLKPVGTNSGPQESGPATFTNSELKDTSEGWISYDQLDHLKRPTGAEALLKKAMINTGTSANRKIRPPGFISGPKYDHSRGHLIAKQFGGSGDDPKNLVTLYQYPVNDPYMNYYELKIRHALNKGETIRYRVIPQYSGQELIPEIIILEAKGLAPNTTIDFKVVIPNKK